MRFPLQMSPTELAGLSELFAHAVGDAGRPLKQAALVGRRLEEQFIADGWPAGKRYGKELELARRLGVGHRIVRETARVLEARGTARMCRGPGGGLHLTEPPPARLRDVLAGFSRLVGVTGGQVRTAVAVIDRVSLDLAAGQRLGEEIARAGTVLRPGLDHGGYPAVRFFQESLSWLSTCRDSGGSPGTSAVRGQRDAEAPGRAPPGTGARPQRQAREVRYDGVHRTRAGQIFHDLITAVEPGRWTDGLMLGSEFDLCERFAADRAVLRQAIRILEVSELAESLPGRGRGLVARTPGQASLSRMICCHFAASRLGSEDIFPVFRSFSIELARSAAAEAALTDVLALKRLLSRMRSQKGLHPVGPQDLMTIDERQFGLVRNPLLELFARSLKAYSSWLVPASFPEAEAALDAFVDSTAAVADAIADRDPNAAAAAQLAKFDRMTAVCSARIAAAAPL